MFPAPSGHGERRGLADNAGGIFQSIRFWQGWAVAGTAAALFAFVANTALVVDGHTPDYVALIGDAGKPAWVANVDLRNGTLQVRAQAAPPAADKQYVLWTDGEAPQRLGVLPGAGERRALPLTDTVAAMLAYGKTLAVSTEPVDTEPAATPPAEWAYTGVLNRL